MVTQQPQQPIGAPVHVRAREMAREHLVCDAWQFVAPVPGFAQKGDVTRIMHAEYWLEAMITGLGYIVRSADRLSQDRIAVGLFGMGDNAAAAEIPVGIMAGGGRAVEDAHGFSTPFLLAERLPGRTLSWQVDAIGEQPKKDRRAGPGDQSVFSHHCRGNTVRRHSGLHEAVDIVVQSARFDMASADSVLAKVSAIWARLSSNLRDLILEAETIRRCTPSSARMS